MTSIPDALSLMGGIPYLRDTQDKIISGRKSSKLQWPEHNSEKQTDLNDIIIYENVKGGIGREKRINKTTMFLQLITIYFNKTFTSNLYRRRRRRKISFHHQGFKQQALLHSIHFSLSLFRSTKLLDFNFYANK